MAFLSALLPLEFSLKGFKSPAAQSVLPRPEIVRNVDSQFPTQTQGLRIHSFPRSPSDLWFRFENSSTLGSD
jgi:hypothetical protein